MANVVFWKNLFVGAGVGYLASMFLAVAVLLDVVIIIPVAMGTSRSSRLACNSFRCGVRSSGSYAVASCSNVTSSLSVPSTVGNRAMGRVSANTLDSGEVVADIAVPGKIAAVKFSTFGNYVGLRGVGFSDGLSAIYRGTFGGAG